MNRHVKQTVRIDAQGESGREEEDGNAENKILHDNHLVSFCSFCS